ncbi:Urease subunit alpha [Trichinella spiralis]|uniref:Urease subunit alpha n=1 Tax=Trichinella spiralis TaxID=6334 RepID=A0ABR3K3T9_TRISP
MRIISERKYAKYSTEQEHVLDIDNPGVMMAEQMSGESSPREDEPMQCMLATEMKEERLRELYISKIEKKRKEEDVKWRFSYRRAPWCGGYWERLERSVKTSLRRVLAKALVTRE